jgi:phage gpG-like protein
MASAALTVTASADLSAWQGMADRLRAFGGAPLDAAMDEIGEGLVSSTKARFHAQHDPSGNPWKPSQRAIDEQGETLIDTAKLIGSLTHNVMQGKGVEWGSPMVYARVHQEGADIIVYPRSQKIYRDKEKLQRAANRPFGEKVDLSLYQFVKKSKATFESWATITEKYTIHVTPRPYLGIDNADIAMGIGVLTRHLSQQLLGRALGATS